MQDNEWSSLGEGMHAFQARKCVASLLWTACCALSVLVSDDASLGLLAPDCFGPFHRLDVPIVGSRVLGWQQTPLAEQLFA
jgi:hypothetical protein